MGTIVLAYHGDVAKCRPPLPSGGTVRIHEISDMG